MWWNALLASFGLIFVAELGDKTQLLILTLAAKCGFKQVFLGAAAAFTLLNALAVSVGILLYELVPESILKYTVSGIFILFGVFMLLPEREKAEKEDAEGNGHGEEGPEADKAPAKKARGPLLTAFLFTCLMELGDKTQLSILALTARYSQPIFVFAGATLAMWATTFIGALVGAGLGRLVPQVWMRRISGVIFIAFGTANLFW